MFFFTEQYLAQLISIIFWSYVTLTLSELPSVGFKATLFARSGGWGAGQLLRGYMWAEHKVDRLNRLNTFFLQDCP